MKASFSKRNTTIICTLLVLLIISTILIFKPTNTSVLNVFDISKINYLGNIFDSSKELFETLDTKEDCIFDLDVFSGKKVCFDVLDIEETRIDTNFIVHQLTEYLDVYARNNNVDNGLDELEIVNQDFEKFRKLGYFNRKYKIASTSLEDYLINIYSVVYRNHESKFASKVFIFISNDSNHILLTYYSKNKQISDELINKLVKDISIKSNNEKYTKEEMYGSYSNYRLECSSDYKIEEVDGVEQFVYTTYNDPEVTFALNLLIDGIEYQNLDNDEEFNSSMRFKQKDDKYTFKIALHSSKAKTNIEIIQYSYMGYENVDIKDNYRIDNRDFLKVEYVRDGKKHIDYYYLYDNGMYVTAMFEANEDYIFNYQEIEKLLEFDIYQL